jgi:hypothetical protein
LRKIYPHHRVLRCILLDAQAELYGSNAKQDWRAAGKKKGTRISPPSQKISVLYLVVSPVVPAPAPAPPGIVVSAPDPALPSSPDDPELDFWS